LELIAVELVMVCYPIIKGLSSWSTSICLRGSVRCRSIIYGQNPIDQSFNFLIRFRISRFVSCDHFLLVAGHLCYSTVFHFGCSCIRYRDQQSKCNAAIGHNTVQNRCIPQHSLDLNPDFRSHFPNPAIVLDCFTMNNEHYYSAAPTGEKHRRTIKVQLAGRTFEVDTAGNIFSPDGVDRGTKILLDTVPKPPETGRFLDIGAGWGPVALTMGLLAPKAQVTAVEVNARAADLTRSNIKRLGLDNIIVRHPDEV